MTWDSVMEGRGRRLDLEAVRLLLAEGSPHLRRLGYEILELSPEYCVGRIPYAAELVGDPRSGVLHGGVVTTLLDSTAGAAVFGRLEEPAPIATLDLRIDYLRPARPRDAILARVECFRMTRSVAFVRGIAYDESPEDPVAAAAGTFMLRTSATRAKGTP